ncbi:hypothetical protein THIX_10009 [Thiomonas sp. X19]|nr:hypothetical protein THIX_10009 [Thiomonas sp. X19]
MSSQRTLLDAAPSSRGGNKAMAFGAIGPGVRNGVLVDGEGAIGHQVPSSLWSLMSCTRVTRIVVTGGIPAMGWSSAKSTRFMSGVSARKDGRISLLLILVAHRFLHVALLGNAVACPL